MKQQQVTVADFVTILQSHLNIMAIGISGANPGVPGHILMPSLAAAMGKVLSEATASPDIQLTLSMRKNCIEAFTDALRKHAPAIPPESMPLQNPAVAEHGTKH